MPNLSCLQVARGGNCVLHVDQTRVRNGLCLGIPDEQNEVRKHGSVVLVRESEKL